MPFADRPPFLRPCPLWWGHGPSTTGVAAPAGCARRDAAVPDPWVSWLTRRAEPVTRRERKVTRAAERRVEAAVKLLIFGAVLTLVPFFVGNSPLAKAFAALTPIGLMMLAAGGLFVWLGRRGSESGAQGPRPGPSARGLSGTWTPPSTSPPPVDRTVTELQRNAVAPRPSRSDPPSRPTSWSAEVFALIEWRRFEALVEDLFRQGGFETKSQSHGPDSGVDVWLYSRNQPGTPVSVVQCKHWQGQRVGVDKIRELRGVMAAHEVRRGQFATTSTFTPDAIDFARANSINLLDAHGLLALIARRAPDQQQALLRVALEGDYWRPTCVNCGIKMVDRAPRKGGKSFWGCTNYPRCKTTMQMRVA